LGLVAELRFWRQLVSEQLVSERLRCFSLEALQILLAVSKLLRCCSREALTIAVQLNRLVWNSLQQEWFWLAALEKLMLPMQSVVLELR
jgi:hypothetical protein